MRRAMVAMLITAVAGLGAAGCGEDTPAGSGSAQGGSGAGAGASAGAEASAGTGNEAGGSVPDACTRFTEAEAVKLLGGPVKKQEPTGMVSNSSVAGSQCGYELVANGATIAALYVYDPKDNDGRTFNQRMVGEFKTVDGKAQDVPGYGDKAVYAPGSATMLILDDGVVYQLIRFGKGLDLADFKAFADVVK